MKSYFTKRYTDFISDKFQWTVSLLSVVVAIASLSILPSSDYYLNDLIRMIFCFTLPAAVFFGGRESIFWALLVYGYVIIPLHDYTDFISFIIVCIFSFSKPKFKIEALVAYIVFTFGICQLHHKDIAHLIIHLMGCAMIYFVISLFIDKKMKVKPLVLDQDQRKILTELAKGKQQKEIEGFSKNTITKKIREAMNNNDCATKEELLSIFIIQTRQK